MGQKSRLRRVLRERNNLSDDDSDNIVRVLNEYSQGRLEKREAARQLRPYVPEEQQANLLGVDLDDLLPLVLALVGGNEVRGQGGVGDMLGRFLGDRGTSAPQDNGLDIGDLLGGLLGGGSTSTPRNSQGDLDLRGLLGGLLNQDDDNDPRTPSNSGGLMDMLNGMLGSGSSTDSRSDRSSGRDHNLRKRD